MSLVYGKTLIAGAQKCKYDATAISSMLSRLSSISGDLSSLVDGIDQLGNQHLEISAILNGISVDLSNVNENTLSICKYLDDISSSIIQDIHDASFMEFNTVQMFTELSLGQVIYENMVDGWYYTTCPNAYVARPMVGDVQSYYQAGTYAGNVPRLDISQQYVPVKAGTHLCFPYVDTNGVLIGSTRKLTGTSVSQGHWALYFVPCNPSSLDTNEFCTRLTYRSDAARRQSTITLDLQQPEFDQLSRTSTSQIILSLTLEKVDGFDSTSTGAFFVRALEKNGLRARVVATTPNMSLRSGVHSKTIELKLNCTPHDPTIEHYIQIGVYETLQNGLAQAIPTLSSAWHLNPFSEGCYTVKTITHDYIRTFSFGS